MVLKSSAYVLFSISPLTLHAGSASQHNRATGHAATTSCFEMRTHVLYISFEIPINNLVFGNFFEQINDRWPGLAINKQNTIAPQPRVKSNNNSMLKERVSVKGCHYEHSMRRCHLLCYPLPTSNQIYLVTFMCLKVDTSFIYTKQIKCCKMVF